MVEPSTSSACVAQEQGSDYFFKFIAAEHVIERAKTDIAKMDDIDFSTKQALLKNFEALENSQHKRVSLNMRIMLDSLWEKLNTGHWTQVLEIHRRSYGYASLLLSLSILDIGSLVGPQQRYADSLRACDWGLLMGAPILDNILARLASILHSTLTAPQYPTNTESRPSASKVRKIDHGPEDIQLQFPLSFVDQPTLSVFSSKYLKKEIPVKIVNAMQHWPAVAKWSVEYLREIAGFRTVPVEIGSKYTEDAWTQKLITINEFIDSYLNEQSTEVGYLAQHQLFDQIEELEEDICIPDYCSISCQDLESIDKNAWFGPPNTISPLHTDPKDNFLCQVVGSKYVRLYSPSQPVYPCTDGIMTNTSQVDVENPDLKLFPDFSKAKYSDCILAPGEMLFIPKGWWHYVRSLELSFSVSFWF